MRNSRRLESYQLALQSEPSQSRRSSTICSAQGKEQSSSVENDDTVIDLHRHLELQRYILTGRIIRTPRATSRGVLRPAPTERTPGLLGARNHGERRPDMMTRALLFDAFNSCRIGGSTASTIDPDGAR
jgi:hypothetical protein